jgi:hypothetical protein
MVSGWRSLGITNMENEADRAAHIPNPLPDGVQNKLQRDPSLANILTTFPDLLMRECTSARTHTDPNRSIAELYADCGIPAQGGASDWTLNPATGRPWQELRLGRSGGLTLDGGLIESLQWDFAFTGGENELMAMIPYCEDLAYTQRHIFDIQGDALGAAGAGGRGKWGYNRIDCSRGLAGETLGKERCTFVTPQHCGLVQAFLGMASGQAGAGGAVELRQWLWQLGAKMAVNNASGALAGNAGATIDVFALRDALWSTDSELPILNVAFDANQIDIDLDGVPDHLDNCPALANPNQSDWDEDGLGNYCDPDPAPEPGAGVLLYTGLLGLQALRRRRP